MKVYDITYSGPGKKMPDYTVTLDDNGQIVDSTDGAVKEAIGKPFNKWPIVRRHYVNAMYSIAEQEQEVDDMKKFGDMQTLIKLDAEKQMVFGWAYVTADKDGNLVVDKSGEFVDDPEELESGAYDFVIKSRSAGDSHRREGDLHVPVGTMVESIVFTPEKVEKMGLPKGVLPTGWWVGFKIHDAQVWKDVKDGKRPAFSIHGKAVKEVVTE